MIIKTKRNLSGNVTYNLIKIGTLYAVTKLTKAKLSMIATSKDKTKMITKFDNL